MDRLHEVCNCTSLQDVWQIQHETFAAYDFDRIIYGYSRFFTPNNFGPREDILMLSNHTQEVPESLYRWADVFLLADGTLGLAEHRRLFLALDF